MPVKRILEEGRVPVKLYTEDIEPDALQQLVNVSKLPVVHGHVAAMPDMHLGIGATVGSVIPTRKAIIPAAVGVDIGCGMNAVRLSLSAKDLPESLARVRSAIEAAVPVGFAQHRDTRMVGPPRKREARLLSKRLRAIVGKHPAVEKMQRKFDETWLCQIGSLGGGNHFIELCLDEEQRLWAMLHSGSRGVGNALGRYFIAAAKKDMQRHHLALPDRDLAYVSEGSALFDDYVEAVHWAQEYALLNRREMMRLILEALESHLPTFEATGEAINCHHNYVAEETHFGERLYVTRKGAISARAGELGIIPGSMGARSYIVRGKGSPESFESCSHGAGRTMSRTQAKATYSVQDHAEATSHVECRKDKDVVDETPMAYKPIEAVMAAQSDLVEIVNTLRQVLCVKG